MKVLVIGASGLVGGNIVQVLSRATDIDVLGTHRSYITDKTIFFDPTEARENWPDIITSAQWDYIIHTGALTHVDKCEEDVALSYLQTVESTRQLVLFAQEILATFVFISTDYIFDGVHGPYRETAITNPLSVYGKHKLTAENLVRQNLNENKWLILRVTNVYGDELRGKNFVSRTIAQLKTGEKQFKAPSDQFATPINAADIASCLHLLMQAEKNGIYHLGSTDYISRVQLIQRIAKLLNREIVISAVPTSQLNQIAPRPLYGGLIAAKFLSEFPNFQFSNIDDYVYKNRY